MNRFFVACSSVLNLSTAAAAVNNAGIGNTARSFRQPEMAVEGWLLLALLGWSAIQITRQIVKARSSRTCCISLGNI